MENQVIEIKFGNCQQTNEQIKSVYLKSLRDAIHAAEGDLKALEGLRMVVKMADWELSHLIDQAWQKENAA